MNRCDASYSSDCERSTNTKCFRCGLPACKSCSVVFDYLSYGQKRIGLDCLDEMAGFGYLDRYVAIMVGEAHMGKLVAQHISEDLDRLQKRIAAAAGLADNIADGSSKTPCRSATRIVELLNDAQEVIQRLRSK